MDSLAARVCAPAVHRCVLWAEQKAGGEREKGRESEGEVSSERRRWNLQHRETDGESERVLNSQ